MESRKNPAPFMKRKGKPTNLYLNRQIKQQGKTVAKQRYGLSLSDLVERLLLREIRLKRGLRGRLREQDEPRGGGEDGLKSAAGEGVAS
jgi:hypothetical protein